MDDFNERTLILLRDDNLKMADEIERLKVADNKSKNKILDLQEECTRISNRLNDSQQEEESTREWANTLHNELLILRGQVIAYKHCIAAMTGKEIPLETTSEKRG